MTLKNNRTFVSPRNQKITRLNSRPHCKYGQPTKDSYGFEYPSMTSLVDAVISQVDNEFPRRQFASGCSFDDIVWQQAIGALMNQDHSRRGCDMADDEKVLFDLVSSGRKLPKAQLDCGTDTGTTSAIYFETRYTTIRDPSVILAAFLLDVVRNPASHYLRDHDRTDLCCHLARDESIEVFLVQRED
ncbi:hypothetical protein BDM02DRAFT_3192293 [Thelephora ganbajun]|uniref:Uncharacterized protein n=1 Tax=Thelephora ganbajun TaxID=370292 RepID=A0ACB6Z0R4_THEGA|nr:hypothetical protein BDM02DRAFT_3192293 [Thelephora ganbajun]